MTTEIHRLLPQSPDAEKGVLASFLLAPREVGGFCVAKKLTPAAFHIPAHVEIFGVLLALWSENKEIDFIILTELLRDSQRLDQVGGAAFVTELFTFLPTAANLAYYVEIVQEKRTLREIIKICTEYAARGYDEQDDVPGLLAGLEAGVAGIASHRASVPRRPFKELLMETIDGLSEGKASQADVQSGIRSLDGYVRMVRGNFIVIAGEAKSGKTALAVNILAHATVFQELRAVMLTLEMSPGELTERLIAGAGRVNVALIANPMMQDQYDRVMRAGNALMPARIDIISDCREMSEITACVRQIHAAKPVDLVVLDYLQLVDGAGSRKGETRQEVVAQVSRTCKRLAVELNCVVIALSQLNDDGKLRESRAIGQDANAIIGVEKTEDGGRCLSITQRNGASGVTAAVQWMPQFTLFTDQ